MDKKAKNSKISESMKGNKNAETWTITEAKSFMNKALELSKLDDYDYIGEVAKKLDSYIEVFGYLVEKYPSLKTTHKHILSNCATNCFSNAKKGKIREATAIMNLKSNHGWTDRVQNDNNTNLNIRTPRTLTKEEAKELWNEFENGKFPKIHK